MDLKIQRKFNNDEFEVIGYVQGSGTTTEKQNYSFIDNDLIEGNYQYRLKQIDYDGSYSFSNVAEIKLFNDSKRKSACSKLS